MTANAQRLSMIKPRVGITLLELLVVIGIVGVLCSLGLAAIHYVRQAAYRINCSHKLSQIGIALHGYHDEHHSLPPGCSYLNGRDPYPHMSWCTRLLPYLDQSPLWEKVKSAFEQEPFFVRRPPHIGHHPQPLFQCPSDARAVFTTMFGSVAGFTFYLGVEGTNQKAKDGVLYLDSKIRFADVTDGQSNTLLVGERPPSSNGHLGWWYAGWGQDKDGSAEMILGAREIAVYAMFADCPPTANRYQIGRPTGQCDALHFWSMHPGGAHFLFADGSVHFLSYSADKILPALATRAGNETVELP